MLTIREPIKLKCERPMQSIREDVPERMLANYGIMQMPMRREELLHVTSEPMEVYFAEGDQVRFVNNTSFEKIQDVRLDVINNVMNRIMVAQTDNFTYQDTVYISSVLRKLGIRDEKTFMKQIFALQNEQKETNLLLKKYEENQDVLEQVFQIQNQQKQQERSNEEALTEKKQQFFLHNDIFKRLETSKIYQYMGIFAKNYMHESKRIFREEMQLGEQLSVAPQFQLQQMRQTVTKQIAPIQYQHSNQYEYLQEITEDMEFHLEEQMSAAILLNLADISYALRQDEIQKHTHNWYSLAGALFQTSENTWKRFEANLHERKFVSNDTLQMLEEVTMVKQQEGDTLEKIRNEYSRLNQQWMQDDHEENLVVQKKWNTLVQNDEVHLGGGAYYSTNEEIEFQYLTSEEEEEEQTEETVMVESLQKQLEIISKRNEEVYKKYNEIQVHPPQMLDRRVDRKKAQKDVLRALENPKEVLMEYMQTNIYNPVEESQRILEKQIYDMFSEETKEIYRQFLQQEHTTNQTFLEHIMAQPEENELRQEVVEHIRQIEQQQNIQYVSTDQYQHHIEEKVTAVTQNINETIQNQIQNLNQLQQAAVYEKWTLPTEIYWQVEVEREHMLEEESSIFHETWRENAIETLPSMGQDRRTKSDIIKDTQILVHPEQMTEIEEYITNRQVQQMHQEEELLQEASAISRELRKEKQYELLVEAEKEKRIQAEKQKDAQFLIHPEQVTEIEEFITNRQVQQIHHVKEAQLTEIEKTLEHRFVEQERKQAIHLNEHAVSDYFRNLSLVHKVEEKVIDEELMQELQTRMHTTKYETQNEEMTVREQKNLKKTVQETVNHMTTNRVDNIEELVQQSMKRQLGTISDQVYNKLEKKLQTERKRRGFS